MNNFKTQVDIDITLDRQDNHDIETKKVNLRWDLELEMRQYGIKSFIITVPDQKINLSVNVWGEDDDSHEDLTLDVKDVIVEIQEGELGSLIPHTLEFYKGKWKLVFG